MSVHNSTISLNMILLTGQDYSLGINQLLLDLYISFEDKSCDSNTMHNLRLFVPQKFQHVLMMIQVRNRWNVKEHFEYVLLQF